MSIATAVKERPILFSQKMVAAILAGHKTQTRRAIKPQPESPEAETYFDAYNGGPQWNWWDTAGRAYLSQTIRCPYGRVGDRLWVRESAWFRKGDARVFYQDGSGKTQHGQNSIGPSEKSPESMREHGWKLRPSIHMPRWACRIVLETTGIRAQRLTDISVSDAFSEGVQWDVSETIRPPYTGPVAEFAKLWESINGNGSWTENHWVWALTFKRLP